MSPELLMDAIDPEDFEKWRDFLSGDISDTNEAEYRVLWPNGTERWLREKAFPVRDDNGEVYRIAGITEDITSQVEAGYVEQASQAKTEFLSIMSHELRTPLNAVIGFSQLLQVDDDNLTFHQKDNVSEVYKGGTHLLLLINDVLDLAKVESGYVDIDLNSVKLANVVNDSVAMIKPISKQYAISIDNTVGDADVLVMADNLRLKQVLINLITNGIKYNKPGGNVRVELGKSELGEIEISVVDTGVGISVDNLDRLF